MVRKDNKGITVGKKKNFSKWYTELVQKADLIEYTAVSGCIALKPNAFALWEKIMDLINERLKKLDVKNVYFSLLIPESHLSTEAAHV